MCSSNSFGEHNFKNILDRFQMTNLNRWNPSTSRVMHVHVKFWKFWIYFLQGQAVKKMMKNEYIKQLIKMYISLTAWSYSKLILKLSKLYMYMHHSWSTWISTVWICRLKSIQYTFSVVLTKRVWWAHHTLTLLF